MKFLILILSAALFTLLIMATSPAIAGGSGFVGNGGDAVSIDGELILQDLWDRGDGNNPYIGAEIDPSLPPLPDESAMPFDFPRDLLARKLTDLNRACPGLGDFILASMKNYTWVLEDYPLTPIFNPDDPVELPAAAELVQIANRFGSTIRIAKSSFQQLNPSNQVALLIHEAVYSLVTPMAKPDGTSTQPAYVAREITGSFFNASFLAKEPDVVLSSLSGLGIPHTLLPLGVIRALPTYSFVYGYFGTNSNRESDLGHQDIDFSTNPSFATLKASVAATCAKVAALRKHLSPRIVKNLWLQSAYTKRPVILHTHTYLAAPEVRQLYLTFDEQPISPNGSFYMFKDVESCSAEFDTDIDALITGAWNY